MKRTPTVAIIYNGPDRINHLVKVPVIPDINQRIEKALKYETHRGVGPSNLYMRSWHGRNSCGTTHCIGGFACVLSGAAGRKLEKDIGFAAAAQLIFECSLLGEVPDFYVGPNYALLSLRDRVRRERDAIESAKLSGEAVRL